MHHLVGEFFVVGVNDSGGKCEIRLFEKLLHTLRREQNLRNFPRNQTTRFGLLSLGYHQAQQKWTGHNNLADESHILPFAEI